MFAPQLTHESAIPGVRFTVRRMGFGRRTDLDLQTLKLRQRLREIEQEHPPQSDREKEISRQLEQARKKAIAILDQSPEATAEADAVYEKEILPIEAELVLAAPLDVRKQRAVLNAEYSAIECQVRPYWIRAGLISIEGGEFDGMTADQLLDFGPQELASEIYTALVTDGKLSGEQRKNLQPLTTSDAPVGGTTNPSSAPGASNTSGATASPNTPAT